MVSILMSVDVLLCYVGFEKSALTSQLSPYGIIVLNLSHTMDRILLEK